MSAARISVHTRKRLWARSGGLCAFPDCDQELLHSAERGREDTIVGKECHVVAQQDHPSVARSPSSLCDDERERYAALIEHRHHFANLILLCGVHSDVIDDPAQAYAIHDVLAMKQRHEKAMDFRRRSKLMVHSDDRHVSPDLVAETVRVTLLDDAPVWARKALAAMAKHDPEGLAWLHREVGDPAQPDRIADLVERWPPRLATGSEYLIQAVVRYAESAGLWREATSTWERLAERREGASKADALTRAAIDAGIGHEPELRERLLDAAASIDPDAPRMRLERLDQNASPADQLILLEELEADDPALSMLISCHRARAAMRLPDLDAAREHLEIARGIDPDAFLVRGTEVNMRIQEARIAVNDDRPFEIAAVRRAAKEALDLRDELIRMGRWGESGSLLMLAADTPCVLRDPSGATAILSRARPEELATPDGAHVLGDAALRAGAPELALEFTADAPPDDAIRRIRATADVDLPARGRRASGLATLEELALSGRSEARMAAFARLGACLPPVKASWHAAAAAVLAQTEERIVTSLQIMAKAVGGRVDSAMHDAEQLPNEPWAAEIHLRLAAIRGNRAAIRQAVGQFLRFAPDQSGRILAARVLASRGTRPDLERAGEIATGVAYDPNAPPRVRSDAFDTLLQTLGDRDEWQETDRHWRAWQEFCTSHLQRPDGRLSAWQARVIHHGGGRD